MNDKKYQIAEELLLSVIELNTYQELDLPCEFHNLTTNSWQCDFQQNPKMYVIPVYKLEKHILLEQKLIARYIVYLDSESLDFVDEFFIAL